MPLSNCNYDCMWARPPNVSPGANPSFLGIWRRGTWSREGFPGSGCIPSDREGAMSDWLQQTVVAHGRRIEWRGPPLNLEPEKRSICYSSDVPFQLHSCGLLMLTDRGWLLTKRSISKLSGKKLCVVTESSFTPERIFD